MISQWKSRAGFACLLAGLIAFAATAARAQSFYSISKRQYFLQTSSAAPASDASRPFDFSVESASAVSLVSPSGSSQTVPASSGSGGDRPFGFSTVFSTKAELDAAFPNGTYRLNGTGVANVAFNFTTDAYPTGTPQVTGGTWNAGGLLVLNPAQTNTISISAFTGYGTTAVSHAGLRLQGLSDQVELETNAISQPLFGQAASPTAPTGLTIPAGTMTAGRVYEAEVEFDAGTTFDTTSIANSVAVALFGKTLKFYVAAVAAGTTPPAIAITAQPANQVTAAGTAATFNINYTVGGAAPTPTGGTILFWSFNGRQILLDGTKYSFPPNSPGLRVNNVTTADAGTYTATIIGAGGIVTSNAATLTIGAAPAPTISSQPISRTIPPGATVVFNVGVGAGGAATIQWRRDGTAIPGATSSMLVLGALTGPNAALAGNYTAVVSNSSGSITSSAATLTVQAGPDRGRLINLSILTSIPTAGANFTMGYVVGGDGTTGEKPLVIRAAGPSLGALGVPGTLADPKMEIFAGATKTGENDNWGGSASLAASLAAVGAFAYTGPTSLDAAAVANITTRDNSVKVSANGTGTGAVIAEVYDATPSNSFNASTPRLINVSVNKQIDASTALTTGFVIGGSTAKTVLIRAVGPSLGALGVPGVMPDPQLTLFNNSDQQVIASNNDWGGGIALADVSVRVGAFALASASSRDAVLLVTLDPGSYSAEARGVGNAAGITVVEVYDVP